MKCTFRKNGLWQNVFSVKYPFGKISFGEMDFIECTVTLCNIALFSLIITSWILFLIDLFIFQWVQVLLLFIDEIEQIIVIVYKIGTSVHNGKYARFEIVLINLAADIFILRVHYIIIKWMFRYFIIQHSSLRINNIRLSLQLYRLNQIKQFYQLNVSNINQNFSITSVIASTLLT